MTNLLITYVVQELGKGMNPPKEVTTTIAVNNDRAKEILTGFADSRKNVLDLLDAYLAVTEGVRNQNVYIPHGIKSVAEIGKITPAERALKAENKKLRADNEEMALTALDFVLTIAKKEVEIAKLKKELNEVRADI
jgi:hypothetical protein